MMLHFPSTLNSGAPNGLPRRTDSLNATQQKSGSDPLFLKIEEELHDARRVRAHGQEEDLRLALDMVINRVTEMSSLLTESYRTRADLEIQLNVAKSNLALVISNNEMLEDALRRDSSGGPKEIGWRKRSGKDSDPAQERRSIEEWQQVSDISNGNESGPGSTMNSPQIPHAGTPIATGTPQENNRFFKFRFASNSISSRPTSRPSTPSAAPAHSPQVPSQFSSPTLPTIPPHIAKEIEDLNAELEKERSARKTADQERVRVEAEIESLSQALFEEANKMVATERFKLAITEEELKEQRVEKEALKRALQLIEGENHALRESAASFRVAPLSPRDHGLPIHTSRSRSSSEVAIKSQPGSPILDPVPSPPALPFEQTSDPSASTIPEVTPKGSGSQPLPPPASPESEPELGCSSPWTDNPSSSHLSSPSLLETQPENPLYAAATLAAR